MTTTRKKYFNEDDFSSVKYFEEALTDTFILKGSSASEHQKRDEMVSQIINMLENDGNKTVSEKISLVNAAIVHPAFSSRRLGAVKRGLNSLFSGKGVADNTHPFFQSTSQNLLVRYRDKLEKNLLPELTPESPKMSP